MTSTTQKITGYRQLTEAEISLMNEIKQKGIELENLIAKLNENPDIDLRWLHIGTTDLQKGLMSLTRAVARPTSF